MSFYRELKRAAREAERHYLYEMTVGAGLPIISTLRDLVKTGDRVFSIEGALSGTLSYIFHLLDGLRPFSEIVLEAKARGYTEPDPRDDLSGMDVARKLVILAREMGLEVELEEIEVESLIPATLQHVDVAEFLERLPELDPTMAARARAAAEKGEKLCYVGRIETITDGAKARLTVAVRSFAPSAVFSRIKASDNVVAFRTARYDAQPLIVQGPGAGPQVTAAGVFGDLLRLASYLGAHL